MSNGELIVRIALIRTHKRRVGILLLFCVVFAAVLSFSDGHAAKESGLGMTAKVNSATLDWHPCSTCTAEARHDADPGEHQNHDDCSCHDHSHETDSLQLYFINHLPHATSFHPFEPFKALPDIYLEKFIPPQNLA